LLTTTSQENMTNAANEMGCNHGPLEQVGEALGGVFGGGENQSLYLESSYCLQYQNYKKETIIANFSL
jgi:hypothetical protein